MFCRTTKTTSYHAYSCSVFCFYHEAGCFSLDWQLWGVVEVFEMFDSWLLRADRIIFTTEVRLLKHSVSQSMSSSLTRKIIFSPSSKSDRQSTAKVDSAIFSSKPVVLFSRRSFIQLFETLLKIRAGPSFLYMLGMSFPKYASKENHVGHKKTNKNKIPDGYSIW